MSLSLPTRVLLVHRYADMRVKNADVIVFFLYIFRWATDFISMPHIFKFVVSSGEREPVSNQTEPPFPAENTVRGH